MNSSNDERWVCPNCGNPVFTAFCPQCGESPPRARELTVGGLFHQLIEAFTSIDGRLVRSFRYLLGRPGFLTLAYIRGQRKPYIGPVPLFLLANVMFFATESLTGGSVFTTPLQSHLKTQPWSAIAEPLVSHRLETLKTTLDVFTPNFNRAVARNARSFIMLMALSFALPVWSVFGPETIPVV